MRPNRRIFAYWTVLLLATLAVGGASWLLLSREQERLQEREGRADSARRAALVARVQLAAENVELLVGDAQGALLDTLAEVPGEDVSSFAESWHARNALVRMAFLAHRDGTLMQPKPGGGSDEETAFVRRLGESFRSAPPWAVPVDAVAQPRGKELPARTQIAEEAMAEQRQVQSNRARVASARSEVKSLSKRRSPSYASSDSVAGKPTEGEVAAQWTPDLEAPGERGWAPRSPNGRLTLIGWLRVAGEDRVRGVEMNLAALATRVGGVLPAGLADGEGLLIRDEKGRILHQVGEVPPGGEGAGVQVPLSGTMLPGWSVAGFLRTAPSAQDSSRGLLLVGSLLVAILVLVILSAGSLLLWQARRSEIEALQKTSFVANVSHELRTPLTTIRLYSELLEQGRVRDEARQREYLATIGRETQRLGRLVNNALDFSRLEQGRKKYQLDELDLGAALSRIVSTFQPRLEEAGIEARVVGPADAVRARVDRDAFEQIVLNLVENVCKYAVTGGSIDIQVERNEAGAEVRFCDRGPGIPAEHRDRIFEKFQRVDDALTAEKSGAGLGLSIARQLARGMGGDIHCEPREGGGAVFVVSLP